MVFITCQQHLLYKSVLDKHTMVFSGGIGHLERCEIKLQEDFQVQPEFLEPA